MNRDTTIRKYADHELFQIPEFQPKIKLWRYQWIGIPLLLLIPILALLNVFGVQHENISYTGNGVEINGKYPVKMRYGQEEFLRLEIKNGSKQDLKGTRVIVDKSYVERFDGAEFSPDVTENYSVNLGTLKRGETKIFSLKLKAGKGGTYDGGLTVMSQNKQLYRTDVETVIYP